MWCDRVIVKFYYHYDNWILGRISPLPEISIVFYLISRISTEFMCCKFGILSQLGKGCWLIWITLMKGSSVLSQLGKGCWLNWITLMKGSSFVGEVLWMDGAFKLQKFIVTKKLSRFSKNVQEFQWLIGIYVSNQCKFSCCAVVSKPLDTHLSPLQNREWDN